MASFHKADFFSTYEIGSLLGQGACARVHKCTHKKTGRQYAVKIVDASRLSRQEDADIQREVGIMKALNHRYIVHLKEAVHDANMYYMVEEYLHGGCVFLGGSAVATNDAKLIRVDIQINRAIPPPPPTPALAQQRAL